MAARIVNGHGGYLSVFPTVLGADVGETPYGGEVKFELTAWQGQWSCDYAVATPSGSGNGTLFLPRIGANRWTAVMPLDSTQVVSILSELSGDHYYDIAELENNGFTNTFYVGMPIYEAYFRRGNEVWLDGTNNDYRVYDVLERTVITDVQMIDDNTDALRVMLSGMGGRLLAGYTVAIP